MICVHVRVLNVCVLDYARQWSTRQNVVLNLAMQVRRMQTCRAHTNLDFPALDLARIPLHKHTKLVLLFLQLFLLLLLLLLFLLGDQDGFAAFVVCQRLAVRP